MKYKVGDKVRIKSLDWYNENKDNYGAFYAGNGFCFWKNMVRHCGEIMKITSVKVDPEDSNKGFYFMENSDEKWTDGMIEGLVEEETYDFLKTDIFEADKPYPPKPRVEDFLDMFNDTITLSEGFVFRDQDGNIINATKIILEKKKSKYPNTPKECCEVLNTEETYLGIGGHKGKLLQKFQKLLICRDAYWKIAGEQMGLSKPWEPDWTDLDQLKYCIWVDVGEFISMANVRCQHILAFPTEEMRDAFYVNFKKEIEMCKELL